jgi:hypothetical protein
MNTRKVKLLQKKYKEVENDRDELVEYHCIKYSFDCKWQATQFNQKENVLAK